MEKSMFDTSVDVAALTDAEFLALVKQQNRINLAKGIEQGWWEEFDDKGPIKVHRISKSKFEDKQTMAHVVVHVLQKPFFCPFDSIGDARKNGWNKPITVGTHVLNKGRIKIVVEE